MHAPLSLSEFKQLVDVVTSMPRGDRTDHNQLYSEVCACFSASDKSIWNVVISFQAELVIRSLVDSESLSPYFGFSDVLRDCLKLGGTSTRDQHDWARALRIISAHRDSLALMAIGDEYTYKMNPQFVVRGTTAQKLRGLGYDVSVLPGGTLDLSESSLVKLAIDIDVLAKRVGGENLMNSVLHNLATTFNATTGRFQLVRDVSMTASTPEPQIPWGRCIFWRQ